MAIERADWNLPATVSSTDVSPAAETEAPSFSADDLALISRDDVETSEEDIERELDAEDLRIERSMLASGLSREEVAKLRNRPVEEIGKPRGGVLTRQSIDQELTAIAEFRRKDRRAYFKDERLQSRERQLLTQRQQLEAQPAAAKTNADDLDRRQILTELDEIAEFRRKNRAAYYKDAAMQARELELIEAREQANEVALQQEQVQTAVQAVLDAVDDPAAFEASFNGLSEAARAAIAQELALPAESPSRPANEAALKRFASTAEGAELVKEWGKKAPAKVAIVRLRIDRLLGRADMDAAARWFDELPAKQAAGIMRALAG